MVCNVPLATVQPTIRSLPNKSPMIREYDDCVFDTEREAVGWAYGSIGWIVSSISPLTNGKFVAFVYRDVFSNYGFSNYRL
jgi:hypothetical protein